MTREVEQQFHHQIELCKPLDEVFLVRLVLLEKRIQALIRISIMVR